MSDKVILPTEKLITQFLHFCRQHYAEHTSEIQIGEIAKERPEFIITPVRPKKNENNSDFIDN